MKRKEQIMLVLNSISKIYKAGNDEVHALNNVSLSFRKNEFVSILGPSGSGKTTLLNIIGGLDKYTSGDLIIAGKSTKEYKDRDWDKYRNLRIGFIFQAYNLIPHQTVLSNVELALTISGITKEERRERAIKALEKVGLKNQINKKPNQMSGGQCQRVAIARALVNNPEILLADEPTGALDTKTSVQIMELIKEIAKDRLVIMVTHNPELAEKYSTRIIRLLDGEIHEDSNPVVTTKKNIIKERENKVTKAKMSFTAAFKLSFKNLLSKLKRTILVTIASSIGIIGVATVLSVSFGVSGFITGMQDDMLSSYPLSIAEEAIDLESLTQGLSLSDGKEIAKFDINTQVGMDSMIEYLMDKYTDITNVKTNDINEDLLAYLSDMPAEYLTSYKCDYGIDVTNNIFTNWTSSAVEGKEQKWMSLNGLTQRYISELKTVQGFSSYSSYVKLFANFMRELPGGKDYILSQYDLLGNSQFPQNENEILLVADKNQTMTDLNFGQMGFYPHDDFINIGLRAVNENQAKKEYKDGKITKQEYEAKLEELKIKYPYDTKFNYDDLIGKELVYFPQKTLWEYNENVSQDFEMSGSILGISNTNDVCFLIYSHLNNYGYDLDILTGNTINSASGETVSYTFARERDKEKTDPTSYFDGFWGAIDTKTLEIDKSNALYVGTDLGPRTFSILHYDDPESEIPTPIFVPATDRAYFNCTKGSNVQGFSYPTQAKNEWINSGVKMKVSGIVKPKETTRFGCLQRGIYFTQDFAQKYINDGWDKDNKLIYDEQKGFKKHIENGLGYASVFKAYTTYNYLDYTEASKGEGAEPTLKDDGYAMAINSSGTIGSIVSSLTSATSTFDTNQAYFRSICGQKIIPILKEDTEEITGYKFEQNPQRVQIYPKNFDMKNKVNKYLDAWNEDKDITIHKGTAQEKVLHYDDRKTLTYTDTVQMIITVINSLITIVTIALVSFTSLSLVVSCFMIAVITYISVMERVKEIGVIRSLGGRKKDVTRLFTAENLMTGLASGVLGVAVTYGLSGIINLVIRNFGVPAIAMLPWWMAFIMVFLSIFLNVLSGAIPSRNAAKQDPVNALRSE